MRTFVERLDGRRAVRLIALSLGVIVFLALLGGAAAQDDVVIPTFTIESVVVDGSVTILAQNFPANQEFVVTMGPGGTLGIGGTPVAITNSGLLGAFSATYAIPPTLIGARQIAIRLESPQGYFSYNWFWNNLAEPAPTPIPTISIESVVVDETVTIRTHNFPADRTFVVLMGHMGTLGIDGTPVGTFYSGLGGTMTATFPIPVLLKGLERIAIRAEATPFYAYNWFDNPVAPLPTPTFTICGVVRDEFVVIRTDGNFPANRDFAVMVNGMGTLGMNGTVVGGFNSGPAGSAVLASFLIPSSMRGLDQIAIRAEEVGGPFFSFNYFDNQTAVYCMP
jgi:hypothetical protein